nr:hypothetical protein [uncultured Butyrivibrio sp.]
MIKKFKEPGGLYLTKIIGQDRLAFAMTDTSDFIDSDHRNRSYGRQLMERWERDMNNRWK